MQGLRGSTKECRSPGAISGVVNYDCRSSAQTLRLLLLDTCLLLEHFNFKDEQTTGEYTEVTNVPIIYMTLRIATVMTKSHPESCHHQLPKSGFIMPTQAKLTPYWD